MKCAIISPISLLEFSARSDYHLVLPHLLDNPVYKAFYRTVVGYKILDNGIAEGMQGFDLFRLGYEVRANEIVVPDVIGDCNATVDLINEYKAHAINHPEFKYMGVLQGKNMSEVLKCFNAIVYSDYIKVIGIPRVLCETIGLGFRVGIIGTLRDYQDISGFEIHCLGASTWIREVQELADIWQPEGIRGIDTSLPIVMGLADEDVETGPYMSRQPNFFEAKATDDQRKLINDNVETYLSWTR